MSLVLYFKWVFCVMSDQSCSDWIQARASARPTDKIYSGAKWIQVHTCNIMDSILRAFT